MLRVPSASSGSSARALLSAHLVFVALLASGCASEEQLRADFDAHVEESNACVDDAECALISPGCPLGCFAAVRADRLESCEAYAARLVERYELGGASCEYDCIAPGPLRCEEGRCSAAPIE